GDARPRRRAGRGGTPPQRRDDQPPAGQRGRRPAGRLPDQPHTPPLLVPAGGLDEADPRRKGATINHLRGNEAAVLLGDYLISHSYHLCSGLESQLASRAIGRTTNIVCEGELLQIDNRNNLDLDEQTYLTIIDRKTASLCAT